jgi:hypothetical protein
MLEPRYLEALWQQRRSIGTKHYRALQNDEPDHRILRVLRRASQWLSRVKPIAYKRSAVNSLLLIICGGGIFNGFPTVDDDGAVLSAS